MVNVGNRAAVELLAPWTNLLVVGAYHTDRSTRTLANLDGQLVAQQRRLLRLHSEGPEDSLEECQAMLLLLLPTVPVGCLMMTRSHNS